MDMNKLRRELDSIKGGMEDINRLLLDTETASEDLVSRLAALGTISNKKGIVRSIVTRATAGIPSVYQLMQQLSSMLLVFKYISVARNQDLKEEQKMVEALKNRSEIQRRMYKLNQAMAGNNLSVLEKERFYNDASIKHMMRTMSLQKALTKTSKRFLSVKQKTEKIDDRVFKRSRKQFVRDNYGNRGLEGGNLLGKAAILMADDEIKGLDQRRDELKKGRKAEIGRKGNLSRKLNRSDLTESQKRRTKAQLDLVDARLSAFSEAISGVTEEIEIAESSRDGLISGSQRRGFRVGGTVGARSFTDLTPHERFMQKVEKIKLIFVTKIKSIAAGLKMFFNKGNMKMLGNAIKMGAAFLGKALLAFTLIGLIVFTLQKINFFEKTKEIFEKIMEFISPLTGIFSGSLGWLTESLPLLIDGIQGLISGLFGGDGSKVWENLKVIFIQGGKALLGLLGVIIFGGINILVGIMVGGISSLSSLVVQSVKLFVEAVKNLAQNPIEALKGTVVGLGVGGIAGAVIGGGIGSLVGPGGTIIGAKIGAGIGGSFGGYIGMRDGMASGGTNLLGGAYLVGENGPETVLLPGGSSVINNTNTRSSMGTTINVHVNGRVGASDQELNQLADKIGQKISMRMNRFSPTGMRG